jgi:hypothetical protein
MTNKKTFLERYSDDERTKLNYLRKKIMFERAYPLRCKNCQGAGWLEGYYENQSPFGSGLVWNEYQGDELCPQCMEKGICPLCQGALNLNNDCNSPHLHIGGTTSDGEICLDCGFNTLNDSPSFPAPPEIFHEDARNIQFEFPQLWATAVEIADDKSVFCRSKPNETRIRVGNESRLVTQNHNLAVFVTAKKKASHESTIWMTPDEVLAYGKDHKYQKQSRMERIARIVLDDLPFQTFWDAWDNALKFYQEQEKTTLDFLNFVLNVTTNNDTLIIRSDRVYYWGHTTKEELENGSIHSI